MIALNERFLVLFGGTPYGDTFPMVMLDLRKGELLPIRMKGVKIGIELRFFSMNYIPETMKLYISGGVYFVGEEVSVSKEMIVCDFSDARFQEDVFHFPKSTSQSILQSMLDISELSDLTLESGDGKMFPVHKLLFVVQSNYFRTMLLSDFGDSQDKVIKFDDIDGHILEMIIKYIYANDIPLQSLLPKPNKVMDADGTHSEEEDQTHIFLSLVKAANYLGLDELCNRCFSYIMKSVNSNNALEMIAFSKIVDGEKSQQLRELCFKKLSQQQLLQIATELAEMKYSSIDVLSNMK